MERLSLSNATFEGANNAYLFDGPDVGLVDTGDWTDTSRDRLREHLARHGLDFGDVDVVLLTHWHPDHTGLAAEIQAAGGATVAAHPADARLIEGDADAWDAMYDRLERYFEEWGMPVEKREVVRERVADPELNGPTPTVDTFVDGDRLELGGVALDVVHSPGHALGHCLFEFDDEEGREILSGDALLPVYTPNVGGADVRVERPLETYLRTLRGIVHADYDRAWPGHRDPIGDPAERAAAIVHHHEERAWRVLDALRRLGPSDPWALALELFGELDDIHALHGPGEVYAHLDHLQREGSVVRDEDDYRLAPEAADALDSLDEERWSLSY